MPIIAMRVPGIWLCTGTCLPTLGGAGRRGGVAESGPGAEAEHGRDVQGVRADGDGFLDEAVLAQLAMVMGRSRTSVVSQ